MDTNAPQSTVMFAQQLERLLATLTKLTQHPNLSTPTQDTLAVIEKQSTLWLQLANAFPIQFCAIPQVYKGQYSYSVNIICHHIIWATLLCKRLQWADLSTQYVIRVAMSLFLPKLKAINLHYQHKKPLDKSQLNRPTLNWIQGLSQLKQPIWEEGLSIGNLHGPSANKQLAKLGDLSQIQQISWLSAYLSIQLTPNKSTASISFSQLLRHIAQSIDVRLYSVLDGLVANPGLLPPGSFVITKKQQFAWIISQQSTQLLVQFSHKDGHFEEPSPDILKGSEIKQVASARYIKDMSIFPDLWSEQWEEKCAQEGKATSMLRNRYKLDQPPALLKNLHQELESREPDLSRICTLINRDAQYAQHIQASATQNSRQHLPFHEVKHALVYNGYYRTGCILTQQALITRLTQDNFPLQTTCLSIIELACNIGREVTKNNQQWLTEEISCFITILCCGYFINPTFKVLNQPKHQRLAHFSKLLAISSNPKLINKAVILAKAWQQDTHLIQALGLIGKVQSLNTPRKAPYLALVLEFSLSLALELYIKPAPPRFNAFAQFETFLGISQARFNDIALTCLQNINIDI